MKLTHTVALLLAGALAGEAQMTRDQRLLDFQTLAAQFAKRYAPYEWKVQLFGFDLMRIGPWLDRVAAAKDDLEYYETCIDYTASLQDGHVTYLLPSDYRASLGFTVDLYDDKPLIDVISRSSLPVRTYPFVVGDEVVSVDGIPAGDLLAAFSKYRAAGNPRSTRRDAAQLLSIRVQTLMPHAPAIDRAATVVVRRQATGAVETYQIPWAITGVPLIAAGPVPSPQFARRPAARGRALSADDGTPAPPPAGDEEAPAPNWFAPLRKALYSGMASRPVSLAGFAETTPVFNMPSNFQMRLGSNPFTDAFFSGTYVAGGKKIGFIRIPSFEPDFDQGIDPNAAVSQFQREITFFQSNTDGLIVDVTRNPGGYPDYALELLRRLIPRTFQSTQYELRATAELVQLFSGLYDSARLGGAPADVVARIKDLFDDVRQAYSENRGLTGPLPLDGLLLNPPIPSQDIPPATDRNGNMTAYTKPVMVLIDETSFSAADLFAAVMQDNHAALLFGYRTAGLGGVLTGAMYDASAFSEGAVSVTVGLTVRSNPVATPDYPTTAFIENVGVHPDVQEDYMTLDNLLNKGKTYVDHFTAAMQSYIDSKP